MHTNRTFARRVRGTGLRGVFDWPPWGIFTFSFTFPFVCLGLFLCPWRGTDEMWEVGVIIKERERRRAGVRLREEDSAGRRGRTLRAGAGIGPEVP